MTWAEQIRPGARLDAMIERMRRQNLPVTTPGGRLGLLTLRDAEEALRRLDSWDERWRQNHET